LMGDRSPLVFSFVLSPSNLCSPPSSSSFLHFFCFLSFLSFFIFIFFSPVVTGSYTCIDSECCCIEECNIERSSTNSSCICDPGPCCQLETDPGKDDKVLVKEDGSVSLNVSEFSAFVLPVVRLGQVLRVNIGSPASDSLDAFITEVGRKDHLCFTRELCFQDTSLIQFQYQIPNKFDGKAFELQVWNKNPETEATFVYSWSITTQACPNDCSDHGECGPGGICHCESGYNGEDCSGKRSIFTQLWFIITVSVIALVIVIGVIGLLVWIIKKRRSRRVEEEDNYDEFNDLGLEEDL